MSPIRKYWRGLLSIAILATFSAWTVLYVRGHWDEFSIIADVPLIHLLGLYLVFSMLMACNGLFIHYIMKAYGTTLKTRVWVGLSFMSSAINFFMPMRAGAGFRATYLKGAYDFPITSFLSTFTAMYLIHLAVHGGLGVLAALVLWGQGKTYSHLLALLFLLVALASMAPIILRFRLPEYTTFPLREIARVVNGWESLRNNRALFFRLVMTVTLFASLTVIQYKIAFSAYDISLSMPAILFFVCGRNMAMFVSLTPASFGIVEGLAVFMGSSLNYSAAEGLMVQALVRTVTVTTLVISIPFASHVLGVDLKAMRSQTKESRDAERQ